MHSQAQQETIGQLSAELAALQGANTTLLEKLEESNAKVLALLREYGKTNEALGAALLGTIPLFPGQPDDPETQQKM